MKKKIKLIKILSIFAVFFIFENGYAISKEEPYMCDHGKWFEVTSGYSKSLDSKYTQAIKAGNGGLGLSTNNPGSNQTFSGDGLTFNYTYLSNYGKCYNSVENNQVHSYSCNLKYRGEISTTQTINPETGKINVIISLPEVMANQIDRITAQGYAKNKRYDTVSKNNKKIIISGVDPATDNDSNLTIYIILTNINANDFDSNGTSDAMTYCNEGNNLMVLAVHTIGIQTASSFLLEDIDNKFINTPNCQTIINNKFASETFKRNYVPECYQEKLTLSYARYISLEQELAQKRSVIESIFVEPNESNLIDQKDLKCTNSELGLSAVNTDNSGAGTGKPFAVKNTVEYSSSHWTVLCQEKYYVEADNPQLVYAGGGVQYNNRVEVDRVCHVHSNHVAHKPEPCRTVLTLSGLEGTSHDNPDPNGPPQKNGGPTGSFDNCVKECDGGEYTQECINACYEKIYNNDNSSLDKIVKATKKDTFNNYVINKIGYNPETNNWESDYQNQDVELGDQFVESVPTNTETTQTIPFGNSTIYVKTEHTVIGDTIDMHSPNPATGRLEDWRALVPTTSYKTNVYIDCNPDTDSNCRPENAEPHIILSDGVSCPCCNSSLKIVGGTTPPGCGDPSGYYAEVAASRSEYEGIRDSLRNPENLAPINEYTITLKDSKTGKKYTVSGSSNKADSGVHLNIEKDSALTQIFSAQPGEITTETIGDADQGTITDQTTFRSRVVYNISLPEQYSLIGDGNTVVIKGNEENGYYQAVEDSDSYRFKKVSISNRGHISTGENVYYTAFDAKDFNVDEYIENVESTKLTGIDTGNSSLLSTVSKAIEIKGQLPANMSREKLLAFWGNPEMSKYLNNYSYDSFAAYISNKKLYVKPLVEKYDNIDVSFEIGTTGDKLFKSGTVTKFDKSQYKCYYGVYNMLQKPGCDPEKENCDLSYYYHEINPEKIFDQREPRWNWTGTITGNKVTGAASNKAGYIVDPERLIAYIESNGNKIYTDEAVQAQELDYEFTLDSKTIKAIRKYNKTGNNGKRMPYTQYTLEISNNNKGDTFSNIVSQWLGGTFKSKEVAISQCNNAISGSCYNYNLGGK